MAAVLGIKRFEVQINIQNGCPVRMKCNCPISNGGGNCEHMAAVLYAIEAKEQEAELHHSEETDEIAVQHQLFEDNTVEDKVNNTIERTTKDQSKEIKEINISKDVVDPDDVEMLQDLIITCINEALRKVDSAQSASMGKFNIPGMM